MLGAGKLSTYFEAPGGIIYTPIIRSLGVKQNKNLL
jgi:hypothetical protein